MSKRKLRRQLSLVQLIMLGTAGTIAAEIFVLTGHVAGMAGPASVLALLVVGILCYSFVFNYAELATAFPLAGGGVNYVREAWGTGLLSFLVGSLDCLSSMFYAALSAVGFGYSLQVLIPSLPVVPIAVVTIGVFAVLNILGVSNVGKVQVVLGVILLALLATYVVFGFTRPGGFSLSTLAPDGNLFIKVGTWANLAAIFATMALIFNAYVGFEIIAHDAEEVLQPERNIPRALIISMAGITVIYTLVALVTLGTVSWQELAGSESALAEAAARFLPRWGAPLVAVAGIIATLTSVNVAILSATREALTLSRDGLWPRFMSRLNHLRAPGAASVFIGAASAAVAIIGYVDFLSYISSAGYLFIVFWSSLSMIALRKTRPELPRPFKAPLFPLTPILAALICLVIVAFSSWQALTFLGVCIVLLTAFYYAYPPIAHAVTERMRAMEEARDRIIIPVANPKTARSLAKVALTLAEASEDTSILVLTVVPSAKGVSDDVATQLQSRLSVRRRVMLNRIATQAQTWNAPLYTRIRVAPSIAEGILDEVKGNAKLVLMGWPGPLDDGDLANHPVKRVMQGARAHVAVLLDRGLEGMKHILVPVGGGFHSRLAIRLGYELGQAQDAQVTVLQVFCETCGGEELEDRMLALRDVIEDVLGSVPPRITTRLIYADDVIEGVLQEAQRGGYDLMVIGASEEWVSRMQLFGAMTDEIAERTTCSVLLARRHESAAIAWLRRRSRQLTEPATAGNGNRVGNGSH